jgi:phenylacetate-CoA ligase
MIIRGVNVFPSQIEELILRIPELAPHLCVLTRPDELTVRVELGAAVTGGPERTALSARLGALIKDVVGVSARVEVLDPQTLERPVGKAKHLVDLRS